MNVPTALLVAGILVVAGLIFLSGLTLGLWFGELGRRKDAQRREGVLDVDPPQKAEVELPGDEIPDPEEAVVWDGKEDFIQNVIAETGCTREEAELEFRTLVSRAMSG